MAKQSTIVHARYDAKNCKNYHLKLVYNTDMDIIEKLASVPSMQGYIKQLIRADIARTYSESVPVSAPVPENDCSAPDMKHISIDNGKSFISPEELIAHLEDPLVDITFDTIVPYMEPEAMEEAHSEMDDTNIGFLTRYLYLAKHDLIIG